MNHDGRPRGASSAAVTTRCRAVQQDTAVTGVDWQVFHSWVEGDPDFSGVVSVLDDGHAQLATAGWDAPTDGAADRSLHRMGWHRIGPWQLDWVGRRTAPVARDHVPIR
jgi:hypothetical protein